MRLTLLESIVLLTRELRLAVCWKACALLALATAVWAQDARGRISGRITDATGAAVAGAAVSATSAETGVRLETSASGDGAYELPLLPPGAYTIEVQNRGFKRYAREAFAVRAGDRLTLDVALEVGQVSESITVSGQAMGWLLPTARNSNLFPAKAKGLVRFRSVASRSTRGRLASSISTNFFPSASATFSHSMASRT